MERFGERVGYDKVEEFSKMRQADSVEHYTASFEDKRYDMIQSYPHLDEAFFVSSYISGLKEELRPMLKMMTPTTLNQAYNQARLQEWSLETLVKRGRSGSYPTRNICPTRNNPKPNLNTSTSSNKPNHPVSSSTKESLSTNKKQCFKCQELWAPGHCCKQLLSMEAEEEEEYEDAEEEVEDKDVDDEGFKDNPVDDERAKYFVHTLSTLSPLSTIRIRGKVGKVPIEILVDSGSTNSFVDRRVVQKCDCVMNKTTPLLVTIANGDRV